MANNPEEPIGMSEKAAMKLVEQLNDPTSYVNASSNRSLKFYVLQQKYCLDHKVEMVVPSCCWQCGENPWNYLSQRDCTSKYLNTCKSCGAKW
jgi:hypothetical protein